MPHAEQFAANLAMMFTDVPFLARFERASAAGFCAIEMSTPELFATSSDKLATACASADLRAVFLNMPVGERPDDAGLAAQHGREAEFDATVTRTIEYCRGACFRRVLMRHPRSTILTPLRDTHACSSGGEGGTLPRR